MMIIGYVVAFVGDLVQVKWKPTGKPLQPKLSKINPIKGLKRIFSMNSVAELVKSLLKIGLAIPIVYFYIRDKVGLIYSFYDMPLMQAIILAGTTIIDLGIRISAIYIIIAAADFGYQKWKFHKDMMMSKQEVKDEYKNSEGDPQVKGKIKRKMMEASRRRMMQKLPEADVVITNPTHYAVAIKYEPAERDAPYVIAKGEAYLAQKIKEVAKEHGIEIVENKPVARALYHNVEIGESVPPELYQAVAEILAFVYHLQGRI
jgi:flagellar biosynthetic protein FlhB